MAIRVTLIHDAPETDMVLGCRVTVPEARVDVFLQPLGPGESVTVELHTGAQLIAREFWMRMNWTGIPISSRAFE